MRSAKRNPAVDAALHRGWSGSSRTAIGLLGFDPTSNIEPNMPIMLLALIFGLSMDYEVFLVSRMCEVRILLGTAVMRPLGRVAWWAPGPPARFCARFGIKEADMPTDAEKPVLVAR
jgi:uncharacterized membrane protein YdfJ with MMPL/SSD domain